MNIMWWQCGAWDEIRKKHLKEGDQEESRRWGTCLRWCGVMPRYDEPDKEMKKVKEEEEDEPLPPVREVKDWEVEMRRGEFTVVASDGACPGQQGDSRLRRAAQALYYGEGHSHNCAARGRRGRR